jgi:hypothetical protein
VKYPLYKAWPTPCDLGEYTLRESMAKVGPASQYRLLVHQEAFAYATQLARAFLGPAPMWINIEVHDSLERDEWVVLAGSSAVGSKGA